MSHNMTTSDFAELEEYLSTQHQSEFDALLEPEFDLDFFSGVFTDEQLAAFGEGDGPTVNDAAEDANPDAVQEGALDVEQAGPASSAHASDSVNDDGEVFDALSVQIDADIENLFSEELSSVGGEDADLEDMINEMFPQDNEDEQSEKQEEENHRDHMHKPAGKRLPGPEQCLPRDQTNSDDDSDSELDIDDRSPLPIKRLPEPVMVDAETADTNDFEIDEDLIERVRTAGMTPADRDAVSCLLQLLLKHGLPAGWGNGVLCTLETVPSQPAAPVDVRAASPVDVVEPLIAATSEEANDDNEADADDTEKTVAPTKAADEPKIVTNKATEATVDKNKITKAATTIQQPPSKPTRKQQQPASSNSSPTKTPRKPASSSPAKKGRPWTSEEDALGKESLWAIAEHDRTEGRFAKVAAKLQEAGFDRDATSVRNRANRAWRHQDGRDDRRPRSDGKPRDSITSTREKKKKQQLGGGIAVPAPTPTLLPGPGLGPSPVVMSAMNSINYDGADDESDISDEDADSVAAPVKPSVMRKRSRDEANLEKNDSDDSIAHIAAAAGLHLQAQYPQPMPKKARIAANAAVKAAGSRAPLRRQTNKAQGSASSPGDSAPSSKVRPRKRPQKRSFDPEGARQCEIDRQNRWGGRTARVEDGSSRLH